MARTIGATTDILLARVRQSGDLAIDNDDALHVLTICQQIIAVYLSKVITTTSFSTTGSTLVYTSFTSGRIIDVHESGRRLHHFPTLDSISAYDIDWFRKTDGTQFEGWHQKGLDIFVLYPAKAASSSVTLTYAKATTIYSDYAANGSQNMELDDEDVELALKLAEAVLLARSRKPKTFKATLNMFMKMVAGNVSN